MKSYFKYLSRNKLYVAIEAFGLSIALAFVIILVSYASMEYRVGSNQKLSKELYVVGSGNDLSMTWGTAQEFFPSIPEIKQWTRVGEYPVDQGVMIRGHYFQPEILAVDSNFLQLFDYQLEGCASQRILTDEHQAIVSKSFAQKAFGTANPIGQTIQTGQQQWQVVGVMEDFGQEEVLKHCDIFVSMKFIEAKSHRMENFGQVVSIVRLAKDANPKTVEATLLKKYMKFWKYWEVSPKGSNFLWGSTVVRWDHVYFSPVTNLVFRQGNQRLVKILLVVALVLLLSAIFNYINLTVAQLGNRAKEMATRRLLGEQMIGVMLRYLAESSLFTAVCFLLGGLMAWVFTPLFNQVLDAKIALMGASNVWFYLLGAYLVITLLSGVFPAIIISRLSPLDVVKGTVRMRSKMWFSKLFVIVQNIISMTLVVLALTMTLQMHYLTNMPLGYQTKDIVQISVPFRDDLGHQMSVLLKQLKALPECEEVAAGGNMPIAKASYGVSSDGKNIDSYLRISDLDSVAMKMLGFKVLEQYGKPTRDKLWISQEAKRAYGVSAKNPRIGNWDEGSMFEVCGVIADFHSGDALSSLGKDTHNAIGVVSGTKGTYNVLVKTHGDHAQALQAIGKTCKQVARQLTGVPSDMEARYLDDMLADSLKENRHMMVLILTFMGISILISALGLFGMSVYYSHQQKRQIALRKVMGATTSNAVWQLTRRYLVSSLVAVVIAIPICVKLMQGYLMDFAYRIAFPWWTLFVGAVFTMLVAFVSVIGCTLRTAWSNPIDSIKTE